MKTIGLIGGMSWESTQTYYQIINEKIRMEMGGLHSAKLILYSVDFFEIEECQVNGDWDQSAMILSDAAISLEKAGADFVVICTNTMHKVVEQIQQKIKIPILHIAEATAQCLNDDGVTTVALLGTKYTMTQDFYKKKIIEAGIAVLVPNEADIEIVNSIIYKELCLGIISQQSKQAMLKIIEKLRKQGAQAVILGCTEIGLLVHQSDLELPVYDTTEIHAKMAAMSAINYLFDDNKIEL